MMVQVVEVVKVAESLHQNRACWVFSTLASTVIPRNLSRDFPFFLPLYEPASPSYPPAHPKPPTTLIETSVEEEAGAPDGRSTSCY